MEHFCVKLGDPSFIVFLDIVPKGEQTDKRR